MKHIFAKNKKSPAVATAGLDFRKNPTPLRHLGKKLQISRKKNGLRTVDAAIFAVALTLLGLIFLPQFFAKISHSNAASSFSVANCSDLTSALTSGAAGDTVTISLTASFTCSTTVAVGSASYTVNGAGNQITNGVTSANEFDVSQSGSNLIFANLTLQGTTQSEAMLKVSDGATIILNSGATITGINSSGGNNTGAVFYAAGNGNIIVNGGSITNNTGRNSSIVDMNNGGNNFTMNSGNISGNSWQYDGGISGLDDNGVSNITIKGGNLSGNFALNNSDGSVINPAGYFSHTPVSPTLHTNIVISGGTFSGNVGGNSAGAIGFSCTGAYGADNKWLQYLTVSASATFSGNSSTACKATTIPATATTISAPTLDTAVYNQNILGTSWSATGQGYNSFDIAYNNGSVSTTYTVSFNSNGGSTVLAQNIAAGSTVSQPTTPTYQGYTFGGWFTDNGTFANAYNFANPVSGNFTLFAKWTASSGLVYNANAPSGSTASGTMPNGSPVVGQNFTLAANAFSITGYIFSGWNTSANGNGASYGNNYVFQPFTATSPTTLFAQWTAISLTFTGPTNAIFNSDNSGQRFSTINVATNNPDGFQLSVGIDPSNTNPNAGTNALVNSANASFIIPTKANNVAGVGNQPLNSWFYSVGSGSAECGALYPDQYRAVASPGSSTIMVNCPTAQANGVSYENFVGVNLPANTPSGVYKNQLLYSVIAKP